MHMHLTLTTEEAVARLQGNWTADVAAYDKVAPAHPAHVGHARRRHHQAVPGALPLAERSATVSSSRPEARASGRTRSDAVRGKEVRTAGASLNRHADENDTGMRPSTRSPAGGANSWWNQASRRARGRDRQRRTLRPARADRARRARLSARPRRPDPRAPRREKAPHEHPRRGYRGDRGTRRPR